MNAQAQEIFVPANRHKTVTCDVNHAGSIRRVTGTIETRSAYGYIGLLYGNYYYRAEDVVAVVKTPEAR
jgi:hypothetical protein